MKIKLKPWNKVVELSKQHGDCDTYGDEDCVFSMYKDSLHWGNEIYAIGPDEQGDFYVDGGYWVHDYMVEGYTPTTPDEVLRYGRVITDYMIDSEDYIRIRLIAYNDDIWYHKMIDGEVVDFKRVGYPYD